MADIPAASGNTTDATTSAPPGAAPGSSPPEIDIERLTEKVYRLMLADLRQERMRRGGKQ